MVGPTADRRAKIDGSTLERLVIDLLTEAGQRLEDFRVEYREMLCTSDGRYEIDVTARFRALGVDFLVLIECKDHLRPVERGDVQILADKKRATAARKAILVSTNGFQRGAIEYAKVHEIALIRIVEGAITYETRSAFQAKSPTPPPWFEIQPFTGQRIHMSEEAIHVWSVERGHTDALVDYLKSVRSALESC